MTAEEEKKKEVEEAPTLISLAAFLENTPPSQVTNIAELVEVKYEGTRIIYSCLTPEIQLHCPHDACNGMRFFRCTNDSSRAISHSAFSYFYLSYICSNCKKYTKVFSLAARKAKNDISGQCYKFGELPNYGPPTPARLIKLIGPDRELFLKGRRCENQGLGIGAFVYYRRVVESQKNRILDEIIKVSRILDAPPATIKALETAQKEILFSKAIDSVKDAIPQVLLIRGHNPLVLLHSALSEGLHDQTDEHCLEIASSIRVVLAELSERLSQALKDEAELTSAVSRLMTKKG